MSGWKPTDCPGPPHCRACVELPGDMIVALWPREEQKTQAAVRASGPVKARTTSWKKASASTRRKK